MAGSVSYAHASGTAPTVDADIGSMNRKLKRPMHLLTLLIAMLPVIALAQTVPHFPSPEPFTVDWKSAKYARYLMREAGFITVEVNGESAILNVSQSEYLYTGFDESYPVGHRHRFTLTIDGEALDWLHSYIEFRGRMVNMAVLFTYQNQELPDVPVYADGG